MLEEEQREQSSEKRKITNYHDMIFFYYDKAVKALTELWDSFVFSQSRFWGPLIGKLIIVIASLLHFTLKTDTRDQGLLKPIRVILGLAIAVLGFLILTTLILIGGSFAAVFGLRNLGEYSRKEELLAWVPLLLLFSTVPLYGSTFIIDKLSYIFCFTIMLIGFDFLYGQCGILSLGHAGFAFMGSFLTAFFYTGTFGFQLPFLPSVVLSSFLVAVSGILLGLPSLRVKDEYLLIMTLAFTLSINAFFKSKYMAEITGLASGGLALNQPNFLGYFVAEGSPHQNYYFILICTVVLIFIAHNLMRRSQLGRAFVAIRCDTEVSKILGVSLTKYKVLAFSLSAFYAAFAGGLASLMTKFVSIENYKVFDSVDYYIGLVIGGMNSILGATLGGAFLAFQIDISQYFGNLVPGGKHLIHIFYGLILILTIYLSPSGVAGALSNFVKRKFIRATRRGSHYMFTPPDFSSKEIGSSPIKRK